MHTFPVTNQLNNALYSFDTKHLLPHKSQNFTPKNDRQITARAAPTVLARGGRTETTQQFCPFEHHCKGSTFEP